MKDISTTVPKTNTKQEPTSKLGEALSAPKNTQTKKPKRHGDTKNHSETQLKTSSIEKVDLSTLTTTGAAGHDTYTDKGNDVSATLETTPIYLQVCPFHYKYVQFNVQYIYYITLKKYTTVFLSISCKNHCLFCLCGYRQKICGPRNVVR